MQPGNPTKPSDQSESEHLGRSERAILCIEATGGVTIIGNVRMVQEGTTRN